MRWFRFIGWRHVVGIVGLFFALAPVVWVIGASLNPTNSLAAISGAAALNTFLPSLAAYAFSRLQEMNSRWGLVTAGAIMGGIPFVLLFQFPQRYIVSGLTAGPVKG